jgi:hypothetical protein
MTAWSSPKWRRKKRMNTGTKVIQRTRPIAISTP